MAPQAPKSAKALFDRLKPFFDDSATARVESPAGRSNWPKGPNPRDVPADDAEPPFGGEMEEVYGIIVHLTGGWPTRSKANDFVDRYTKIPPDPSTGKTDEEKKTLKNDHKQRGVGPQFYISSDGTVAQVLSPRRVAYHGRPRNARTIGVETGNLGKTAPPPGNHWREIVAKEEAKKPEKDKAAEKDKATDDKKRQDERVDLPDARIYAAQIGSEHLLCVWTASKNREPTDGHMESSTMMLFSEEQYRSWALLARWLCEVWEIPRAFPLAPHARRDKMVGPTTWQRFRALVKAEPAAKVVTAALASGRVEPSNIAHVKSGTLLDKAADLDDDKVLPAKFKAAIGKNGLTHEGDDVVVNDMWTRMVQLYRGLHGHGFSGDAKGGDHNCPGALFDWHRFARDVWDWWWFPFDASLPVAAGTPATAARARREYEPRASALREYYFDSLGPQNYMLTEEGFYPVADEAAPTPAGGAVPPEQDATYFGHFHGGMHFRLGERAPVYAACAGQLVAARFPKEGKDHVPDASGDAATGSASFVLLRHEVHHQVGSAPRIDYDKEPSVVYSLYMHLAPPDGMTFAEITPKNPDWLNGLLTAKRIATAGILAHAADSKAGDPWKRRAGVTPATLPEVWERDKKALSAALDRLVAGEVAVFPEGEGCLRVSVGDFLGDAGVMSPREPGEALAGAGFGLHFEVFSKDLISPDFKVLDAADLETFYGVEAAECATEFLKAELGSVKALRDLSAVERARRFERTALLCKSEWALSKDDFPAGGWSVAERYVFFTEVAKALASDPATPKMAQLPADGAVHHYHPLGFIDWINALTWKSEWPKYKVHEMDAAGKPTATLAPTPDRPPSRPTLDIPPKPKKKKAPPKKAAVKG